MKSSSAHRHNGRRDRPSETAFQIANAPRGSREGVRHMRLALAQINVTVGALEANAALIEQAAAKAYAQGASVVAFPELAVTGYPPEDLLLKPGFITDNLRVVDQLARTTTKWPGLTIAVGFVDRETDLYNAAALLRDGAVKGVYRKHFLPNYGVFDEDRYFQSGEGAPIYLIDGVTVGVNICEDIWYPSGPPTIQAYAGAEVLLNLSSSPFYMGKQTARERMLATRAADTGSIVAYVNLVGGQDELVFDGGSVIFNGEGGLLARAKAFEEDLLVVDLDVDEVFRTRLHDPRRRKQRQMEALNAAEQTEPAIVISAEPRAPATDLVVSTFAAQPPSLGEPGRIEPALGHDEEAYRALVLGTRDYVRKNGVKDVIIGLSGGIDSALTATIAVDALGAEHVTGVSMPSRYSSAGSKSDAQALAETLGIRYLTLPIEEPFKAMLATLRQPLGEASERGRGLAEENVQARIRGNLLMALTNANGSIVLTTGNKSEMAVGYATLYGDMAGGFAVLKDVFKTVVYELARWRNAKAVAKLGHPLIPENTITKPPSAELRPDQQDTDSLPPYEELDPILRAYVEQDWSYEEMVRHGFSAQVVRRVMAMVDHSEYKRRQAPPGVKITERAFGRDRRLPITNAYQGSPHASTSSSPSATAVDARSPETSPQSPSATSPAATASE